MAETVSSSGITDAAVDFLDGEISNRVSGLLQKHNFGQLARFAIPDAGERLWLIPKNGECIFEDELSAYYRDFFRNGKSRVRMRHCGAYHIFLLFLPEYGQESEWHHPRERCLAVLHRQSGALHISGCTPFALRGILSAFNSCIGGVQCVFHYNLCRLLWLSHSSIPSNFPFCKIELAAYSLMIVNKGIATFSVSSQREDLWRELKNRMRSEDKKTVLKMLCVRVKFRDKSTRSYRIYANRLEAGINDFRKKPFAAYLALLAVMEVQYDD